MKKNSKMKIIILFVFFSFALTPVAFGAQTGLEGRTGVDLEQMDNSFISNSGLGTKASLAEIISEIIKILLGFLGVIFVVLFIYAGFLWLTSAGNEEKISKAKAIMTAAIIGLAIVLAAYSITYFVIDKILEATSNRTGLDTNF